MTRTFFAFNASYKDLIAFYLILGISTRPKKECNKFIITIFH